MIHSEYLRLFYRNRYIADENSHHAVGRLNANRGRGNSRYSLCMFSDLSPCKM